MTWLRSARALRRSCDVAENLRNLLLKRASPRTRLMAARLSRKMSPGIFGFHLKFERRVGLETVPETPRSRKPVAFDLPVPENVGERVETPGKLRTREEAPVIEGR
jgi:hypothetical protein